MVATRLQSMVFRPACASNAKIGRSRSFYFVVSALLLSCALKGQDRTGRITGTVHDPAGAPVPEAQITARNTQTGIKSEGKSSEGGDYTLPLLDPGTYEISVEHQGFKSSQQSGIVIHVNDQVRLDYFLELGQVNQVVNVHEEVPLLRTTDASLGQVVDNQKVELASQWQEIVPPRQSDARVHRDLRRERTVWRYSGEQHLGLQFLD